MFNADALIFDCDGTLADSMPVHYLASRAVFAAHGLDFPETRFYELAGVPTREIVALLAGEQRKHLDTDVDRITREKEEWFLSHLELVEPIPWVVEQARSYRGKLPLAVASGGVRWIVEAQLERIGLKGHFDAIVTSDQVERHKPDPQVFLEAARRLGVAPERCLVFEDGELGFEAARRAGMPWIDVRPHHPVGRWRQG